MAGIVLLTALFVIGCPIFEDEYTGHYQEMELGEFQDQAMALDLFRFGNEVRGVLRYYSIASAAARDNPFAPEHQIRCRWTRVADFNDDDRSFSLVIPATAQYERVELEGQIDDKGVIALEIDEEGEEESREIRMTASTEVAPDSNCLTIGDFLVRAIFGDNEFNGFDPDVYELRHPVFALLWVGVEPVNHGGFIEYVALDRIELAIRLQAGRQFNPLQNRLMGNLSVSVPPPGEQILVESGDTRYALAHFVVIDDSEDNGRFSWSGVSEEPIVATALEPGRPDDAPEEIQDVDRWGKALLFVEGRLDELDRSMRDHTLVGLEQAELGRHFYIVDVFSYDDQVVSLRLPTRPEAERLVQRRVSIEVTEEYLQGGAVRVPRLFPSN